MKALSFTQPWLYAILHLGKRIENRTGWKGCAYRGPILLHAAKSVGTRIEFDETVDQIVDICERWSDADEFVAPFAGERKVGTRMLWTPSNDLPRGGIVGRANVVGVHLNDSGQKDFALGQHRWYFGGFALVLADVEPLPFVPWKGALGLFDVPDDYATRRAA